MKWSSPWGVGFPGWHLECTAMSSKYLGVPFDIHGGGMDLQFPHHEGEIAQSCCAHGEGPVKYWMHNNMLTINGQKMAKSKGNFINFEEMTSGRHELLDRSWSAMIIRYFILTAHYRSPIDFSNDALAAAEKGYKRLMEALKNLGSIVASGSSDCDVSSWKLRCEAAMNDDFNTPILLAQLFEAAHWINSAKAGQLKISQEDLQLLEMELNRWIGGVLGLREEAQADADTSALDGAMAVLIELRAVARAKKDWATSDLIRDKLAESGIQLKDDVGGTSYTVD